MEHPEYNGGTRWPWPQWAGWLLAALLTGIAVCLVLDREATKVMRLLAWIALAFAAFTDRENRTWGRLLKAVVWTGVVVGATAAVTFLAGDGAETLGHFVKYRIGIIWLAIIYLAVPVISWGRQLRWTQSLVAIALALALQGTLSAGASMFPKDSMKLLGGELLPYVGLFVLAVRMGHVWALGSSAADCKGADTTGLAIQPEKSLWWSAALRGMWLVIALTCAVMGGSLFSMLVYPPVGQFFIDSQFFRYDADALGMPRLQFLFQHHNRAGFFAATGIFLSLAGAIHRWGWRIIGALGTAGAAFALPFTLTRAALIAAAVGMAMFTFLGLVQFRKGRWALLAGFILVVPAMWNFLPESYQGHISKIANLKNYREGAGGSIGARLVMWETAGDMIQERPGLGFGYGFENFEAAAQADNPQVPNYFDDAVHAHNHWLETAAEIGLPGALMLFAFTVVRLWGLTGGWWRSMRNREPLAWLLLLWLCLEVVVQLYGMTNYTLRRNLGYLTYGIWAGSVVLVMRARAVTRENLRSGEKTLSVTGTKLPE